MDLGVDVKENSKKAHSVLKTFGPDLFVVCDQPREDQQGMADNGLPLNLNHVRAVIVWTAINVWVKVKVEDSSNHQSHLQSP